MKTTRPHLTLKIISKKDSVFQGAVSFMKVIASQGEIGFLPGHESFLSVLHTGPVIYRDDSGKTGVIYCSGGFVECYHNELTVIAQHCINATELQEDLLFQHKEEVSQQLSVCKSGSLRDKLEQELMKIKAQIRSLHELKKAETVLGEV